MDRSCCFLASRGTSWAGSASGLDASWTCWVVDLHLGLDPVHMKNKKLDLSWFENIPGSSWRTWRKCVIFPTETYWNLDPDEELKTKQECLRQTCWSLLGGPSCEGSSSSLRLVYRGRGAELKALLVSAEPLPVLFPASRSTWWVSDCGRRLSKSH